MLTLLLAVVGPEPTLPLGVLAAGMALCLAGAGFAWLNGRSGRDSR